METGVRGDCYALTFRHCGLSALATVMFAAGSPASDGALSAAKAANVAIPGNPVVMAVHEVGSRWRKRRAYKCSTHDNHAVVDAPFANLRRGVWVRALFVDLDIPR